MSGLADDRPCTCHPLEAPVPCQRKYAFSECIATAIRQARADALEEAAEAVAFLRWQEVDPYDGRSLGAAFTAIRSLKDKQP